MKVGFNVVISNWKIFATNPYNWKTYIQCTVSSREVERKFWFILHISSLKSSLLVSLSFSTRGFVKLFEGKSLQRFDPAKTEWEILHSTSPPQGRHKRWASVVSTALPPTPCRSNHLLSSTVCWRKHKLFFYQLGWGTVETSISLDQSSLDRFFPFPPII